MAKTSKAEKVSRARKKLNVCFVTGSRAEFGLMETTLAWIGKNKKTLKLQIIATGMHLSGDHGSTINEIKKQGWKVDQTVAWPKTLDEAELSVATGKAIADLAAAFKQLKTDLVLIVGDRVEAFAAASAGHLAGLIVAHVHGGDRAMGQVDDTLRHAITKLSHIHFVATQQSGERVAKLGEDRWRIHNYGAPGIDYITTLAMNRRHVEQKYKIKAGKFGLVVLHPVDADIKLEAQRAKNLLAAMKESKLQYVIVYPNNDPGSAGIASVWDTLKKSPDLMTLKNVPRNEFVGLLRDAVMILGNSSSGIIEAASFGTPVIDIGPRQLGREHGGNVLHVDYDTGSIAEGIRKSGGAGWSVRYPAVNPYGGLNTGKRIAHALASLIIAPQLRRKLIAY